ncbi:MAG: NADH-quinone oxidoreductase subunit B family protein [Candidatus Hodarchaeales archaeon]|jgi:F420-non-reducing hydrogenase small subunit
MTKKTLALVGLTGCTGCSVSFLDLNEEILDVLDKFDLVHGSTLLDTKSFDHADICILEGCVANEHDLEKVTSARERADIIVTLGSCSCFGGINALRNLFSTKSVLDRSYVVNETTVRGQIPEEVPKLLPKVKAVKDEIKVDYAIPGCPPIPELIKSGLKDILKGRSIEEPNKNLCSECNRVHVRMLIPQRELLSFDIVNPFEVDELDTNICFLEQGVLCLGLATKAGCGGRCLSVDMPCRGCMGPPKAVRDHGCAAINALATLLPIGILAEREDLTGTAYRYTLAASTISRAKAGMQKKGGKE